MDRLYTLQQLADLTGFGYETLRVACVRGEIEASKLFGQWRISEDAYRVWVQGGRVERTVAPVRAPKQTPSREGALSLRERVRNERKAA